MFDVKPLCVGWQRQPSCEVSEERSISHAADFNERFVQLGKPVVFRQAVSNASAMNNWLNNNYLIEKYTCSLFTSSMCNAVNKKVAHMFPFSIGMNVQSHYHIFFVSF